MNPPSPVSLPTLCRQRLAEQHVDVNDPAQFEERVIHAVERNLAGGRFQRLAAGYPREHPLTLTAYIDRVIVNTEQAHPRLQALETCDRAAWEQLYTWLARRAIAMLRSWRSSQDTQRDAADFAQQTCLVIFAKPFPCDISFEAWATTILKHLILERYRRSPDALNRAPHLASLDMPASRNDDTDTVLGEQLASTQALDDFDKIENRLILLDAIEQLKSEAQRSVILATWLNEQDDDEIARRLGKSTQAVYNLRGRALARLKEILAKPPRKKS